MPQSIQELLDGNIKWSQEMEERFPGMFKELSEGQHPKFLWIGCSDSRVPATEVTNALPGSIFVQRNIANMVVQTDVNLLSVVYYAIKALKVKHIIVCGHYGCGGVQAAMGNKDFGFLNNWLANIKEVGRIHHDELSAISNEAEKFDRYVELNVMEQVHNLAKISFIQEEWASGEYPYIHGWVYGLKDGHINEVISHVNHTDHLDPIYRIETS